MLCTLLTTTLLVAFSPVLPPNESSVRTLTSGGVLRPKQASYDVQHYDLKLTVDPERREIAGTLAMTAEVVEPRVGLMLDLDDAFEVTAVRADDQPVDFKHRFGEITIESEEVYDATGTVVIEVDYCGKPRVAPRPPWDGGFTWARTTDGEPWIATSCQAHGADIWWPCKDHPSDKANSMDLRIQVPDPLVVAANGRLVSVERRAGSRSYHWRVSNPFSNYVIALNIAPYETLNAQYKSVAGETIPVTFWVLPQNKQRAERVFPQFVQHLAFFEEVFGPYPFRADKYGVAETPHLGMEHQTIIAYGGNYGSNPWGIDRGFDFLHHHELSHEWWANLVTARDWNDFWIHESFATYAQALYTERLKGAEAYRSIMNENRAKILNRGPIAPREARTTNEMYFAEEGSEAPGADIYYKGAWVLHSLRWVLGDEVFFRALRRMAYPDPTLERVTDGSQCRFSSTEEIRAIAERVSGRDLGWFFELYLRQKDLPTLEHAIEDGELRLRWRTPRDLPFPMPVEVKLGRRLERVEMPAGRGSIALGRARRPQLDPNGWILRAN